MMLVAGIIVLSMASYSVAEDDRCVFNPVMNFGKCACSNDDTTDYSTTVTTELVEELFGHLSNNLISKVEQRITDLLAEADIEPRPRDCSAVKATESGIYTIYPGGIAGFRAYCDMDTAGGGWTVIQRRADGSEDFYRKWDEYKKGFGELEDEFWLGNRQINAIVYGGGYELRIDMVGPDDITYYAGYDTFDISDESKQYALTVRGYDGTAGDELLSRNGNKFSTRDQDNDSGDRHCAVEFTGAWWYGNCHTSNLNGKYGETEYAQGITWRSITDYYASLKWVEMKVRPWRNT